MRSRDDSGSASVWAVALTALLLVLMLVAALVVDVLAARSRAAAAADLAALAGAPAAVSSSYDACRAAGAVAAANGAALLTCDVVSGEMRVAATVSLRGPWRRWLALLGDSSGPTAVARAGMR